MDFSKKLRHYALSVVGVLRLIHTGQVNKEVKFSGYLLIYTFNKLLIKNVYCSHQPLFFKVYEVFNIYYDV